VLSLLPDSTTIFICFCKSMMLRRFPGTVVLSRCYGEVMPLINYWVTLPKASEGFLWKALVWSVDLRRWFVPLTLILLSWKALSRLGFEEARFYRFCSSFCETFSYMSPARSFELRLWANRFSLGERHP
jgi:hypothetical protein